MENGTYHYPLIWDNGTLVKKNLTRASWILLHGPAFTDQSQWRLAMEKPGIAAGLQANDGLTGCLCKSDGDPNHLRLCQGIAMPMKRFPCPTRHVRRCCNITCSSFMSHGSRITINGEWSRPTMESSLTADPEYKYNALLERFKTKMKLLPPALL